MCSSNKIQNIIVAAHSSGAFCKRTIFFNICLAKLNWMLVNCLKIKFIYFNLDGGIGSNDCGAPLDSNIASK
jgi:hypothetical protein